MITKALLYAIEKHAGQVYNETWPYITHPIRVALKMQGEELIVVALLHDVIEDSDATVENIESLLTTMSQDTFLYFQERQNLIKTT